MKTHMMSKTRLYGIWEHVKSRCKNKKDPNYGGRGISYTEEWEKFEPFRDWALSHGYADNLSIERKDVDLGYFPENCTWIPLSKQAHNRRRNGIKPPILPPGREHKVTVR